MSEELVSMSVEDLEVRLCGLAARMAATTCSFLLAVGEFDRRRSWEPWECHDMGAWLAWKCGISPVTAREHVRVAASLERFGLVRERFSVGRLSYSQVRAITRVATVETEAQLVEMAGLMTAAQLETTLRAYRRCSRAGRDETGRRRAAKGLSYCWDDDGNLVGRFSLPAEEGALFAAAIDRLVEHHDVDDAEREGADDPPAAARANALIEVVTAGAAVENPVSGDDRYLVTIVADEQALRCDGDHGTGAVDTEVTCEVTDGPGLSSETLRRICCDASTVTVTRDADGTILDVGRRTRRLNQAMRRALSLRDRNCRFPGCRRRRTQGHHIEHWIDGGHTKLDNLVSLCSWHHHRLHEGGFRIDKNHAGDEIRFYNKHHVEIPEVHTLPESPGRDSAEAERVIPYHCDWDGSRPDLAIIIDTLLQSDGLLRDPEPVPLIA